MRVTAWNNGQHHNTGAGYGLKISVEDRDRYFNREWTAVIVGLAGTGEDVEVNVSKSSFWGATCRELISQGIGRWMLRNGYAPWSAGSPPTFELIPLDGNRFELRCALNEGV